MSCGAFITTTQVGSIGQSFYTDGQWHTTATVPADAEIMRFKNVSMALEAARNDAYKSGLMELHSANSSDTSIFQHDVPASCGLYSQTRMRLEGEKAVFFNYLLDK